MSMADTRKPKTRKERSEKFMRNNGIMTDPNMPDLLDEKDAELKPAEEAVKRAVCALCTARAALGLCCENDEAVRLCAAVVTRFGLEGELTSDERKYFALAEENAPVISREEAEKFHWRTERSMPLIWACGLLGENDLEFPSRKTDTDKIFKLLNSCQNFTEVMLMVKMHTLTEILDNMDECFRMYTACIAAQKCKKPELCGSVKSEVVEEQLKGFFWLVSLKGLEPWDEIDFGF